MVIGEEKICQECNQRLFTKMILIDGFIPRFVCEECDKELYDKEVN